jgi:hypothetical protein
MRCMDTGGLWLQGATRQEPTNSRGRCTDHRKSDVALQVCGGTRRPDGRVQSLD